MSKIATKLFLLVFLLSVGGLVIAALFINYQIDHHFDQYVLQEQAEELRGIKELIEKNYHQDNNWENTQNLLNNYIHGRRVLVELIEADTGKVIFSNHEQRGSGRRHTTFEGDTAGSLTIEDITREQNNEQSLAYLSWKLPARNRFESDHSSVFLKNVNRTIFWVAALLIVLSIIISWLFSRYFTKPLLKMNRLTAAVKQGDYQQKVDIKGDDELSQLGNSLNEMVKRLKHLEKTREESTANLAHELRTPLAIISNYVTGLKDGILNPDNTTLKEIEEEISRLKRLVDRLEDLTASGQKLIELQPETFNLKTLINNVVALYKKQAREKEITINTRFTTPDDISDFQFHGDRDAIKSIIINLLTNALKYTPTMGEISLIVNNTEEAVIFKIKDNGIGIPKQDLPYIFSRFYRTDKSRSTDTGGVGLGLTITRQLVRAHNGKIEVDSKPGQTVFTVVLPHN